MGAAEKDDAEAFTTTVSSKGQVVIPKGLRDRMGLKPGDILDIEDVDGALLLRVRRETLAEQKLRLFGPPVTLEEVRGSLAHLAVPGPPMSMKKMRAIALADFGRRYRERETAQMLADDALGDDADET